MSQQKLMANCRYAVLLLASVCYFWSWGTSGGIYSPLVFV